MKLWTNGVIYLPDGTKAHNLMTHDGLITGIDVTVDKSIERMDLKGGYLYPGFTDAHLHLIGYGQYLSRTDISNVTKHDILHTIENDKRSVIILDGCTSKHHITKSDLSGVSGVKFVILRHTDFHSVTVNQQVLDELNLSSDTGILTEKEAQLVIAHFSKESNEVLARYLEKAIQMLHQFGITGGHSDDLFYFNGYQDTLNIFSDVLERLKFRTHLIVHHNVLDDYIKHGLPTYINPFLELGSIKVFFDGTLTSKTALMKNGYKDTDSKGLYVTEDFIEIVKKVRRLGLTLAVHVIGDLGLEKLLEVLEKYPPSKNQKDRLIHTPCISEKGMNMLKNKPITIDAQPQFLYSDLPIAFDILNQKPDYIFPWKTLAKQGIVVSFSSDAPVEIPNPLLGILYATNRRGNDNKMYNQSESITRKEAIDHYTIDAIAQNLKKNRGSIKIGNIADFTVFKHDLETVSDELLKSDLVLMTIIDETVVYERSA
ncbi:MAG: amidohydrolase [Acholeplasma sp.]|jgi:predicted amidohydrolase YtcJ|nr:amidohydrolase [Acholeplasma sp.]